MRERTEVSVKLRDERGAAPLTNIPCLPKKKRIRKYLRDTLRTRIFEEIRAGDRAAPICTPQS